MPKQRSLQADALRPPEPQHPGFPRDTRLATYMVNAPLEKAQAFADELRKISTITDLYLQRRVGRQLAAAIGDTDLLTVPDDTDEEGMA